MIVVVIIIMIVAAYGTISSVVYSIVYVYQHCILTVVLVYYTSMQL